MAQACDPSSLIAGAVCLECGIPNGMQLPVLISLFCKISGMNCDPASLMSAAACLECGIPPGFQLPVLNFLACQILNNSASVSKFASANQSLAANSWSLAHNLGGTPALFQAVMVCTSADAGTGYGAGDQVDIGSWFGTGGTTGPAFALGVNSTTIFASVGSQLVPGNEGNYAVWMKGNTATFAHPSSFLNWALKFYAWL